MNLEISSTVRERSCVAVRALDIIPVGDRAGEHPDRRTASGGARRPLRPAWIHTIREHTTRSQALIRTCVCYHGEHVRRPPPTSLVELPDQALDDRIREIAVERRRLDAEFSAPSGSPSSASSVPTTATARSTRTCGQHSTVRAPTQPPSFAGRAIDEIDGLGEAGCRPHRRLTGHSLRRRQRQPPSSRPTARVRPILLDQAEQLPYSEFSQCVDRFVALADEDGAHDARDDAIEHRDAHVSDVGGMVDITAHGGDGLTTAELMAIHQRFTEAEYRADVEARRVEFGDDADQHPLPRTVGQRRFDALVTIFRRAAAAKGLGTTGDPLVNVVVDAATWSRVLAESGLAPTTSLDGQPIDPFTGLARPSDLLDELVGSSESLNPFRCETSSGVTLHPHDVLRAALAGHVRRVVVDAAGVAIDMGRRRGCSRVGARGSEVAAAPMRASRLRAPRRPVRRRPRRRMGRRR